MRSDSNASGRASYSTPAKCSQKPTSREKRSAALELHLAASLEERVLKKTGITAGASTHRVDLEGCAAGCSLLTSVIFTPSTKSITQTFSLLSAFIGALEMQWALSGATQEKKHMVYCSVSLPELSRDYPHQK